MRHYYSRKTRVDQQIGKPITGRFFHAYRARRIYTTVWKFDRAEIVADDVLIDYELERQNRHLRDIVLGSDK